MKTYVICWENINYPKEGEELDTTFSVIKRSFGSKMAAFEYLKTEEIPIALEQLKVEYSDVIGMSEEELSIESGVYYEDKFLQAEINVYFNEELVESIGYKIVETELQMATLIN